MSQLRYLQAVAMDVLKCSLSHEPGVRLIGNVTAAEVAAMAAAVVTTCPKCGSEAWVNIDCSLCSTCSLLVSGEQP